MRKHPPLGVAYALAIVSFTAYVLLDTFVLQSAWQTGVTAQGVSDAFAEAQSNLNSNTTSKDQAETETTDSSTGAQAGAQGDGQADSQGNSQQEEGQDEASSNSKVEQDGGPGGSHGGPGGRSGGRPHRGGGSRPSPSTGGSSASTDPAPSDSKSSGSASSQSTGATVEGSASPYDDYDDGNLAVSLKQYTVSGTQVYVADVQVNSAEHLKTAFANDTYGKNVTDTTSSIAAANDAVLAINGDYYGVQEAGYVIRNGQVYRSTVGSVTDVCCIYADGTMRVVSTAEKTAEELVAEGVWQAFSFGPALVTDGQVSVEAGTEVGRAMASNPRTAIGIIDANHYLFVVSDGRTSESEGLSLSQLADFMQSLGVSCAYNLDGGGSSTMYYQGQVVNKPTTNGSIKERGVSDIVYVN